MTSSYYQKAQEGIDARQKLDRLEQEITNLHDILNERLLELEMATKEFVTERLAELEKKIDD